VTLGVIRSSAVLAGQSFPSAPAAPAAVTGGSVATFHTSSPTTLSSNKSSGANVENPPFQKLMAANRGEIATRITRAASELGIETVGIYAHEGM